MKPTKDEIKKMLINIDKTLNSKEFIDEMEEFNREVSTISPKQLSRRFTI